MQRTIIAAIASALVIGGWVARAQELEDPLRFSAVAISAGGPLSSPVTAQLEIVIERWSTDMERQRLLEAVARSQDAALDVLARFKPVGSVRTPGNLRWALRYAHETRGEDGGRAIFLATDRPMSFAETVEQPRSSRYPFTVIQLQVNDGGRGEGQFFQAVRVRGSRDGRFLMLENYTVQPVTLTQVRQRD